MDLRATRAEINISHFKDNLRIFKKTIGENRSLCLAVKGNAYGHGLIPMSFHAQEIVDILAVATVNEGVQLRESGITLPIFILSAHLESEIPIICQYKLTPFISHDKFLDQYQYWADYYQCILTLHIKIDTGMRRAGVMPDQVNNLVSKVMSYSHLSLEGVCTHFAMADEEGTFTNHQLEVFNQVLSQLSEYNIKYIHAANSAGILNYPVSHFNLSRVGIGAYGYADHPNLKPVLSLKSKVTIIKTIPKGQTVSYGGTWTATEDTIVGVVPIGYADGYMRCLSNKAKVIVNNQLCPVLGRVCMDQIIIALPKNTSLEDDVLLYGDHTDLNAVTLAQIAGTIPYEILTSISERVPRYYY